MSIGNVGFRPFDYRNRHSLLPDDNDYGALSGGDGEVDKAGMHQDLSNIQSAGENLVSYALRYGGAKGFNVDGSFLPAGPQALVLLPIKKGVEPGTNKDGQRFPDLYLIKDGNGFKVLEMPHGDPQKDSYWDRRSLDRKLIGEPAELQNTSETNQQYRNFFKDTIYFKDPLSGEEVQVDKSKVLGRFVNMKTNIHRESFTSPSGNKCIIKTFVPGLPEPFDNPDALLDRRESPFIAVEHSGDHINPPVSLDMIPDA